MLEGVESKAYYAQRQEFNVCATHRLGTEQWRFGISQAGFARVCGFAGLRVCES